MLYKFLPRKNMLFVLPAILLSLVIALIVYQVDKSLSCDVGQKTQETYIEAFDKGNDYYSNGEIREFLYLYLWKSDKTKQCYTLAVNSYSRALAIESEHTDALANRASAYISLGQYDKAIEDYLMVLEINPQDQYALLGIAQSYEKGGQLELAVLKYGEAVRFMESSEYWRKLHPDSIKEYQAKLDSLRKMLQQQ